MSDKTKAQLNAEIEKALATKARRGSLTFYVFRQGDVDLRRSGCSATAKSKAIPESEHDSFDVAYDAALGAGGDRWIISSVGSSEFVEKS